MLRALNYSNHKEVALSSKISVKICSCRRAVEDLNQIRVIITTANHTCEFFMITMRRWNFHNSCSNWDAEPKRMKRNLACLDRNTLISLKVRMGGKMRKSMTVYSIPLRQIFVALRWCLAVSCGDSSLLIKLFHTCKSWRKFLRVERLRLGSFSNGTDVMKDETVGILSQA